MAPGTYGLFIDGRRVVSVRPGVCTGESEYVTDDGRSWKTYAFGGGVPNCDAGGRTGQTIRDLVDVNRGRR
jgi:hypothetical protein